MWRRVRFVASLVVLGAFVNVGVAFACVLAHGGAAQEWRLVANPLFDRWRNEIASRPAPPGLSERLGEQPASLLVTPRFGHEIVSRGLGRVDLRANDRLFAPYAGRVWWPNDAVKAGAGENYAVASGWPWLSLCAWRTKEWGIRADSVVLDPVYPWSGPLVPLYHWGVPLDVGESESPTYAPRVGILRSGESRFQIAVLLPCRPILPGFVFGGLFYAALIWFLLVAFTARSRIRTWRAQCVRCGYPRGESSICSECGAAVKPLGVVATAQPPPTSG